PSSPMGAGFADKSRFFTLVACCVVSFCMVKSPCCSLFLSISNSIVGTSIHFPSFFQCRDISGIHPEFFCLQDPAHDLSAAGLGQLVDVLDLMGNRDGPKRHAYMVNQVLGQFLARLVPEPEDDESLDHISLDGVGFSDHGGFCYRMVGDERALHLRCPDIVP